MNADLSIRQGDTLPVLASTILDACGNALDLTGSSVRLVLRALTSNSPLTLAGTVTITSAATGEVQYAWASADTETPGMYMGEWHVTTSGGGTYTYPNDGYLAVSVEENLTTPGGQLLVSLAEAKDYLGIPVCDRSRDAKLLRFIRGCQPQVESICGPILVTQREEWHDGGQTFVRVRRRPSSGYETTPVLNLIAVSEYRGPIEYTLAIVQDPSFGSVYSCMLDTYGTITRRTAGGGVMAFPAMPRSVHIWYEAGQSSVPTNVTEGTLELLRVNFQETQQGRPRMNASGFVEDDEEPKGPPLGFFVPGRVREMLSPTRRAPSIA